MKIFSKRIPLAALGLVFAVALGSSATVTAALNDPGVIVYWDPASYQPVSSTPLEPPPWSYNPNAIVSNLTPHGGLTKVGGSVALAYQNWDTVINPEKYVGFTVAPKAGESLVLTGLQFGHAIHPQHNPPNATYNWRYRINEGAGYGDWVISEPFPVGNGSKIWTFASPIVTAGTVEFGFFSAAPTDTYPATVSYGGSNNATVPGLLLYGTAGDVSPDVQGVISRYTRAITYTGNYAPLNVATPPEASTIAYNWDTDTLFCLDDENTGIQEITKEGKSVSGMGMGSLNFPDTGYKGDPEALAYIGEGKFMIGAERQNVSMILTYVPNGWNEPNWMTTTPDIVWGEFNGNVGLEGISYDPTDGTFWGVKETEPLSVIHATGVGTVSVVLTHLELNDVKWRTGVKNFSDVFVMANSDAYADSGHILILARGDKKIIEITKSGQVIDVLDVSHIGRSTLEGITMDNDGVLYLCSEATNTSIDASISRSGLHVLTPPKNEIAPVAGSGRGAVALGTAAADEIYGTSASETFTGGLGSDTFVFRSLRGGVDTITDFTPGVDFIDIGELLRALAYKGTNYVFDPLRDGNLRVIAGTDGSVLQIKSGGSYRTFAILQGLTVEQANDAGNFRFITSRVIPSAN